MAKVFDLTRDAWREAGRPAPRLTTSFWFALGEPDQARAQVHRHLRHYMNWIPAEYVDALAATAGFAGTPAQLAGVLRQVADLGADEVQLIPTSSGVDQVHRLAELLTD
jgi:alkanesulfonate monooxygenase SsuD/methylene tetrahydromethanopterin reductase-like flavin-dependent oxidoreductase (luciferase family)